MKILYFNLKKILKPVINNTEQIAGLEFQPTVWNLQ